jgi:hypothetical protein
MGLDFSYLLYFQRKDIWDVLQGIGEIADPYKPPALIVFPDSLLPLPLKPFGTQQKYYNYDDREFQYAISLRFPVDEAIYGYVVRRDKNTDLIDPAKTSALQYTYIGYIYLTVHNDLAALHPENPKTDWVLFNFGTTGTSMSVLFMESISIRKIFLELLVKYRGVCGVFNREEAGDVFWSKGRELDEVIPDPWLLPDEIERKVTRK